MMHYWIGVASRDHVKAGVAGGFAQLGHGKHAPVQRLSPGDWIVYYSPRTKLEGGDPVQALTAIGKVKSGDAYQVEEVKGFKPFRRDVAYRRSVHSAPISNLLDKLSFTQNRDGHWGVAFRSGVFEITQADFKQIGDAMGLKIAA